MLLVVEFAASTLELLEVQSVWLGPAKAVAEIWSTWILVVAIDTGQAVVLKSLHWITVVPTGKLPIVVVGLLMPPVIPPPPLVMLQVPRPTVLVLPEINAVGLFTQMV